MSYKVKKGDTLSKIAKEHNMSLDELLKLNDISRDKADHILVGQNIKVEKNNPYHFFGTSTSFVPQETHSLYPKPTKTNSTEQTTKDTTDKSQSSTAYWNPMKAFSNTEVKSTDSAGIPYRAEYTISEYAKNNALAIQQQLVDKGYNIGSTGVDGKWGTNSQKALDQALSDGYTFKDGKLNAPIKENSVSSQLVSNDTNLVNQVQEGDEKSQSENTNNFKRRVTPRQYTAAQNTIADLIGAPLRRGLSTIAGEEFTNKILPTRTFNENHLSPELYQWLQDAVDKKWSPEERTAYFTNNPDGEVEKGWKGRIVGTKSKESDYKKYYSEDYTGPMKKGFKSTMFGDGINQAQGTLGSFNLKYTKDGVYVTDVWDFGTGQKFDTSTIMGKIRQAEEDHGSQENSKINPTRAIKAFIKYKS